VSIPDATLSFLYPRPVSPAIGFSVQAKVENLYVRADLQHYWFIFRFLMSPTIEEVLSREPSLFVRLGRFLYTNKATNPFNIHESDFSVGLTVGFSSIFVPLHLHGSSIQSSICVSFVGASLNASCDRSSINLSCGSVSLAPSLSLTHLRQVAWTATLHDLVVTSVEVPAVEDPATIHIPSVDDVLGQFICCSSPASPLLLLKPLTVQVAGITAIPKIVNAEHSGGGAVRDRGRSDVSNVSTESELPVQDAPTSELHVRIELLDLALSSKGVTTLLIFAAQALEWFQQQQLLKVVAFFQNLEVALLSSTTTLEKEAVMPLLPFVGSELVKVTFFLDHVRIVVAGEEIDTPHSQDLLAADSLSTGARRPVSGIQVTVEHVKMVLLDRPKVLSRIDLDVAGLDVQVATTDSGKPAIYHTILSSRRPQSVCAERFQVAASDTRPFVNLKLDVSINPSSFAPTVKGRLDSHVIWLLMAPEIVSSLIGSFLHESLLHASHQLSLVVVPFVQFAAASFGREHSAHVQALQDFSIAVNVEHLFVHVSSSFGSNHSIHIALSGARMDASAEFNRSKDDAGVAVCASASLQSLGAWTSGGHEAEGLHQMCAIEVVKFTIAQHRDSLVDPWVVDTLNFQAPEMFKMTTSKEHLLTFKRLQAKAEEQLPVVINAGSRLHAFFSLAEAPIKLNATNTAGAAVLGRELPEVAVAALEWTCVYVLGQRQHPGVLSARSTGGLSKGNELLFTFSDSKTSGSSCITIPFDSIASVAQGNMALVFPVSIVVEAAGVQHVFAHFVNRDRVFRQLRDLFSNQQSMAAALTRSKSHIVSIRSTVESVARRLKDVDDMFISFHNMSDLFNQFCDMADRLGLQLRQRYPVQLPEQPVSQASAPAELEAIIAAGASSKPLRQKKTEAPPLPPLPPALFQGWINIIPEAEQAAAAALEAEASNAKVGFFSGMAKTLKESVSQTDAKLLASVPLAIRKTAKNARYCAMGREGQCKLYSDEPTSANEKTLLREVIPLYGCVCSFHQRAVNKLASKFGISSDDAMLKQIKIADASGRPLLLFTPFESADFQNFLAAAQMTALMPCEEAVEQPASSVSLEEEEASSIESSPTALAAPSDAATSSAGAPLPSVAVFDSQGPSEIAAERSLTSESAVALPALHPNAVSGALSPLPQIFFVFDVCSDTSIHSLMNQMRESVRQLVSFVDHVLNSTSLADEVRLQQLQPSAARIYRYV
jgi:hypothetical protein